MIRVTELAFGLEKNWIHQYRDTRNVPWHICFISLIAGIFLGDWADICIHGLWAHLFWGGLAFVLVAGLCMEHRDLCAGGRTCRKVVVWLGTWCLLWFVLGFWQGSPGRVETPPEDIICRIEGQIESIPPGTLQMTVMLRRWECEGALGNGRVRVRINMSKEELSVTERALYRGDMIRTEGVFSRYDVPEVPGMFDVQGWAHAQRLSGNFRRQEQNGRFSDLYVLSHDVGLRSRLELGRRHAFEKLSKVSPEGIMPALVLGSTKGISDSTRQSFGHLGIAHVLAVSGLHFGLIAVLVHIVLSRIFGMFPWIMRRFGRNRAAFICSVPVLAVYLLFVGVPISAQRALIMAVCCGIARLFARRSEGARALSVAGIIILGLEPLSILTVSFQLSFSAVLGIIWGMEFYERELRLKIIERVTNVRIQKACCSLVSMLLMSLSTSLTTAPFVIYHFGQLPILGILTNLVVIPYVSFILMPAAMIAAFCAVIGVECEWIYWAAGMAERILVESAAFFERSIPLSYVEMTPHLVPCVLAAMTAIVVLYRFRPTRIRLTMSTAVCIIMLLCIAVDQTGIRLWTRTGDLRMSFVAMGQADATLIEFPDGTIMVMDVGAELGREESAVQVRLIPYLRRLGIRHIDKLVLTHSDYDHVGGLGDLLAYSSVGEIWHNGLEEGVSWQALAGDIPLVDVRTLESRVSMGEVDVDVLWPRYGSEEILREENALNPNESSVVIRIGYRDFSLLLQGDAGAVVEQHLLLAEPERVTVLKAGHHGSKTASSEAWVEQIRPQFTVFSVGKNNRYHFPHREVVERISDYSSGMYQTGYDGTVRMMTNGHQLRVDVMH